jgi:(p)ppGpp synthase/HD superfamily hydrolase
MACFAHDTIEDTRVTYNDVKSALGHYVADLVYALTNEKGKTRKERANDKYYEGIRSEKYGIFVKMCDRIANVEYSKMSGSRMFEMYKKENEDFIKSLDIKEYHMCYSMKVYLDKVFGVN